MKIEKIVSQHRRDFTALYKCESCEYAYEGSGYDDTYFHSQVVPKMKCPKCREISPPTFFPLSPKYLADMII